MNTRIWTAIATMAALSGCASPDGADAVEDDAGPGGKADDLDPVESAVCLQQAAYPNTVFAQALEDSPGAVGPGGEPIIANYTAWPIYDPGGQSARMDAEVTRRIEDPEEALANIASRFGDCSGDVAAHINEAKPNVYIYFTGFGGADQNNSLLDEGAVLRWINERDPNALIFSINWNCGASNDSFCFDNVEALAAGPDAEHVASMNRAIDVIVPQIASADLAAQLKASIAGFGQQQSGYDSAHSHSMVLAAQLIDQLLVADQGPDGESRLGDIRIAGYSMGAHSAAQVLVQDFTGNGGGYEWSARGCADGGNSCTVAELDKVKWSLSMGLSGWSHALRSHNGLDGGEARNEADRDQFQNGGLFRVSDPAYDGKLVVLNRRMDPTSNSDDTFQRGFNDIFYADYNHYSHDYSLPLFIDAGLRRALDAYLESDSMKAAEEIGIIYDNASKVDFDECVEGESCAARTGYLAHEVNRSHQFLDIPRVDVRTTDGVEHPEKVRNVAAAMPGGSDPITLRTFEQEDLRGGVELYHRPQFDVAGEGLHGIFSYGSCEGTAEELMPEAFIQDGSLEFDMMYQDQSYSVSVDAASVGIREGEWAHLAFTWELPVESLTVPHDSAGDLANALPGMAEDLQEHQVALVLATGLTKPLPTTYKRQVGEGTLTIYVNGNAVAEAPLGTPTSQRECLSAADVLSTQGYDVNGVEYPPFNPYAGYDAQRGDVVAFSADQVLGTKCKAYKVRNTEVFFGCAGDEVSNADADMDDLTLVWGPGRTEYQDVDHNTGAPALWPLGVDYDAEALVLR